MFAFIILYINILKDIQLGECLLSLLFNRSDRIMTNKLTEMDNCYLWLAYSHKHTYALPFFTFKFLNLLVLFVSYIYYSFIFNY